MTLPEPDGLLFDLDGTLVESMPDLRDALDGALKHHGGVGVRSGHVEDQVGRAPKPRQDDPLRELSTG